MIAKFIGEIYREDNTWNVKILWNVKKSMPFDRYDEAPVVEEGHATSYAKAAKDLGEALERLEQAAKASTKKKANQ